MDNSFPAVFAGVSPAPQTPGTSSIHPFPTPSPFSFSITSARWSSRPYIHYSNLFLSLLALLFSFVSALSLACAGSGLWLRQLTTFYLHWISRLNFVGYLLISSSSVAIPVIQDIQLKATIWRGAIISTTMSFVTFLIFANCTLLSGYKLCKRIIW